MNDNDTTMVYDGLEILDEHECRRLLASQCIGRVGVTIGALPAIFPVNYVTVDGDIVFRTGEGTKLRAALERAPTVSPAGLAAGVSALAGSFASPLALRTRFLPGRGDGGAAIETVAYEERCDCFRPRGPMLDVA